MVGRWITRGALVLLVACNTDEPPEGPEREPAETVVDAAMPLDASRAVLDASLPRMDAVVSVPREDAALPDGGTPLTAAEERASLDVLFVIDNSGSMATEQWRLAHELPRLVNVLITGDRYWGRAVPPGLTDAQRRFKPVRSLHLGVVSTNVGGLDPDNATAIEGLKSCFDGGDDGLLQSSTKIAFEGVVAMSSREFEGYSLGDVLLPPDPSCELGALPAYQEFVAGQGSAQEFACTARLGVRGCPFEQPLEAAWKALAPSARQGSDSLYTFVRSGGGQGDRANAGFLRDGAALAVIVLTDEDDCSVTSAGTQLFDLDPDAEVKWGDLNLRCGLHRDDTTLLQPADRYLRGLRALKPGQPERVVFGAITGVPVDAIAQRLTPDAILALPVMKFEEDPLTPGLPRTVCERHDDPARPVDRAFPATRLVQVARAFGAQAVLDSICASSYGPALDRMVDKLVPLLAP
jgi:hypothetical protein